MLPASETGSAACVRPVRGPLTRRWFGAQLQNRPAAPPALFFSAASLFYLSLSLACCALRLKTDRSLARLVGAGPFGWRHRRLFCRASRRRHQRHQRRPTAPQFPSHRAPPLKCCTWLWLYVCVCARDRSPRFAMLSRSRLRAVDVLRKKWAAKSWPLVYICSPHSILCKLPANTFMLGSVINRLRTRPRLPKWR